MYNSILNYYYFLNSMQVHFNIFAGDILEVGVQCSIAMHDIPSFERYMAQLKCYYLDYR